MDARDGSPLRGLDLLLRVQTQLRALHEIGQLSPQAFQNIQANLSLAEGNVRKRLLARPGQPNSTRTRELLRQAYQEGLIGWGVLQTFDGGVIQPAVPKAIPIARPVRTVVPPGAQATPAALVAPGKGVCRV